MDLVVINSGLAPNFVQNSFNERPRNRVGLRSFDDDLSNLLRWGIADEIIERLAIIRESNVGFGNRQFLTVFR